MSNQPEQRVSRSFHEAALAEMDKRIQKVKRETEILSEANAINARLVRNSALDAPANWDGDREKWKKFFILSETDTVRADDFRMVYLSGKTAPSDLADAHRIALAKRAGALTTLAI